MFELLIAFTALGVLVAAGGAGWLAYQTFLQNGRIILRLERLEEETRVVREALEEAATSAGSEAGDPTAPRPPLAGWPPGSVLPDFELATADGGSLTLWEWRGRDVLLIFFDPACDHSRNLFPRLARLRLVDDSPSILLIGTGSPERNRTFIDEHGLTFPVLFQEEREVARLLRADGTPAAYRIDRLGRTTTEFALGVTAVMELARHSMFGPADDPSLDERTDDFTPLHLPAVPTRTALRRTGLRPGERAPAFRLPGLDGEEHTLDEYIGRPLLLVFTDPNCGPCRETMPELERLHRERSHVLKVVAISRGTEEANLSHTRDVTFPVLRQRHWEVSREYAMFATPIAYLIDPAGIIASRPAVGRKQILELAEQVPQAAEAVSAASASA
jgi:peroxiredoxin